MKEKPSNKFIRKTFRAKKKDDITALSEILEKITTGQKNCFYNT